MSTGIGRFISLTTVFQGIAITSDYFLIFEMNSVNFFCRGGRIIFRDAGTEIITFFVFRDVYAALRPADVIIFPETVFLF